jgi:hypothetical protein
MYYSNGILNLPVNTVDLTSIKETINKSIVFKERFQCYISIKFQSGLRTLTIFFEETELLGLIVNVDMYVMTRIMLDTNNSLIDNSIGFSCDKEDLCQQFMFDYLEWLFNVEYNSLALNIRPLLLTGNGQNSK